MKNEITLNISSYKELNKRNLEALDYDVRAKLEKFIKSRKRELNYHFKKDGWDLDFRHLYDDVINHLIGTDLFLYIASKYVPKNGTLKYSDGEWRISIEKEKSNVTKKTSKKTKSRRKSN